MAFILSNNKKVKTSINTSSNDCVKAFMYEIGKYELLKRPRELELAEAIDKDDFLSANAKLELFNANLRLVVSVAKRYLNKGLDMEDLLQEGCIGLCKAIDKYDHTRGYKFSTCAVWWVRQGITRALADKSKNIRIPVHMVSLIFKYKKLAKEVETKLGRAITEREAMVALDIDKDKIALLQRCLSPNKSLDELTTDSGSENTVGNLGDSISNGFSVDTDREYKDMLDDLYENLEQSKEVHNLCPTIISRYYGLEGEAQTQKDICKDLNISTKEFKNILTRGVEFLKVNILEDLYE